MNDLTQQMNKIEREIKVLRTKAEAVGAQAKADWTQTERDLQSRVDDIRRGIARAGEKSSDAAASLKAGLTEAANEVKSSLERAKSHLAS